MVPHRLDRNVCACLHRVRRGGELCAASRRAGLSGRHRAPRRSSSQLRKPGRCGFILCNGRPPTVHDGRMVCRGRCAGCRGARRLPHRRTRLPTGRHPGRPGPGCGTQDSAPPASRPLGATRFGAVDMVGNVAEMVADEETVLGGRRSAPGPAADSSRWSSLPVVRSATSASDAAATSQPALEGAGAEGSGRTERLVGRLGRRRVQVGSGRGQEPGAVPHGVDLRWSRTPVRVHTASRAWRMRRAGRRQAPPVFRKKLACSLMAAPPMRIP